MKNTFWSACLMCCLSAAPALAEWGFNSSPLPNAFIQTNNMTLELQCDRIRFSPAGYEESQDIVQKNGLSFRFLMNGSQEVASFQMGRENSFVQIVDNYPVEIQFSDEADHAFVLDQIAAGVGAGGCGHVVNLVVDKNDVDVCLRQRVSASEDGHLIRRQVGIGRRRNHDRPG